MHQPEFLGRTAAPVIAERQLAYGDPPEPIVVRVHAPEPGAVWPGQTWRCGYSVIGLPGIPAFYEGGTPGPDEVWFAGGNDSFAAIVLALKEIRALLDRVEENSGVAIFWPVQAATGHHVPQWVSQDYGRGHEKRVLEVMEQEETRLALEASQRRRGESE